MERPKRLYYDDDERIYYLAGGRKRYTRFKINKRGKNKINLKLRKKKKPIRASPKEKRTKLTYVPVGNLPATFGKQAQQFQQVEDIIKNVKPEPQTVKLVIESAPSVVSGEKKVPDDWSKLEKKVKEKNKKILESLVAGSKMKDEPEEKVPDIPEPIPEVEKVPDIESTSISKIIPYNATVNLIKDFYRSTAGDLSVEDWYKKYARTKPKIGEKKLSKKLGEYDFKNIQANLRGISGSGNGHPGLFNTEIKQITDKLIGKDEVPVIALDKAREMLNLVKPGMDKFGFIINTNPSWSSGNGDDGYRPGHWRSVFFNNEDDYVSAEYYDPLVENEGEPEKAVKNVMKEIAVKMNPENYMLFKNNTLKRQANNTDTCGYHAVKFINDRWNGVPYEKATGWVDFVSGKDDSVEGEKAVQKDIRKFNTYL